MSLSLAWHPFLVYLFYSQGNPQPPGVLFVVHGTHANQPRSHAGHTSVTLILTFALDIKRKHISLLTTIYIKKDRQKPARV